MLVIVDVMRFQMGRPVFGNVLSASLKLKCVQPALRLWGRSEGVGWILKRLTSRSPVLMALCGVFPVPPSSLGLVQLGCTALLQWRW